MAVRNDEALMVPARELEHRAEVVVAMRVLAEEMLNDGDCYVEHYGRKLANLLRLHG